MARRSSIKLGSTRLSLSPPAVLAVMYLLVIALGALLLWLPVSHQGKVGLGEAIFTATSAVTVTGLVVVDTGSDFTLLGQIIIACLMQFGGLGLMVFAVLILTAFGIPIGMPHKVMLREDLNQATISNLGRLVRIILTWRWDARRWARCCWVLSSCPRWAGARGCGMRFSQHLGLQQRRLCPAT